MLEKNKNAPKNPRLAFFILKKQGGGDADLQNINRSKEKHEGKKAPAQATYS